jgi:hypothetical protein
MRISMAVTPVDAATVILLRKAEGHKNQGFEVLMALRNPKSTFAPDAYVFSGERLANRGTGDDRGSSPARR